MPASDNLQNRIGSMSIDGLAELMDETTRQMSGTKDADTRQALAMIRGFLMEELDRRDPEIVDAWNESEEENLVTYVRSER